MEREIKFRGKTKYSKEWIYCNTLIQGVYNGNEFTCLENSNNLDFSQYEIDPKTLGQYTGLKDKNGVDIYEGDIVKSEYGEIILVEFVTKLIEGNGHGGSTNDTISGFLLFCYGKVFEVIGNVFDNPELLK